MTMIKVKCAECKTEFEKRKADFNYSEKIGRSHFCSPSCSTTHRNKNLPREYYQEKCSHIKQHANNRRDLYSPFRLYLNRGRASLKTHSTKLTPQDLKDVWDNQRGICPYTKIPMILPETSAEWNVKSLKKASLDRIDSSKGYVKSNVEFVCLGINLAKNSFTREEMKEFLKEVVEPTGIEPVS